MKKAIVTVVGKDTVGIIAAVTAKLAAYRINILDISQTILSGDFTMVMSVDLALCEASFAEVKGALAELGESMGIRINMQRSDIFDAMHTI